MRYVQASKDLTEICGLGLTQVAGLVNFDEPATFRLKRSSDNIFSMTTNTGFKLTHQRMDESVRCIETRTLENQWVDVTAQCQGFSIPLQVVREWSDRNQRTLVDFRISA